MQLRPYVLILLDCNVWGEADHAPDKRVVPMSKDKMDLPLRSLLAARQGTDEPDQLQYGDFYCCFAAGKDRRRIFMKPLRNSNMRKGRDRHRTVQKTIMCHVTETSWRNRRASARGHKGHAKLTQSIYLAGNAASFANIRHTNFDCGITGSTRSDVFGPITLDNMADMPKMSVADKRDYYGKRFILAGGRIDADDDDNEDTEVEDDDAEINDDADEGDPPIAWHALPVTAVMSYVKAFNIKHVIDLSPTPLPLAYEVVAWGGSYVALCATPQQADYLQHALFEKLIQGIVNPEQTLLYDPRFSQTAAENAIGRAAHK